MNTRIVLLGLGLALAGCAASTVTATTATVSKAQADLQLAINFYGVARGIANVAVAAQPSLAVVVLPVVARVDPLVAKAQTALYEASLDATAIEALAATINAQATALTVKAAPAVVVVPATS